MNKIERIAKVCHEANKACCEAFGDNTQEPWESAPMWQKESAIKGVEFQLANPSSTPEDSHNSWMAEKKADGWKKGKKKDSIKKTHPCMIPYKMLPKDQKAKDYIFSAIAKTMGNQYF